MIAELEAVRDRLQALVNVRGRFMTRLGPADFQEWRNAERALPVLGEGARRDG
jgi:hypothetical protein